MHADLQLGAEHAPGAPPRDDLEERRIADEAFAQLRPELHRVACVRRQCVHAYCGKEVTGLENLFFRNEVSKTSP